MSCEACVFFHLVSGREGQCRINPPQVLVTHHGVRSRWPTVDANDWCGECLTEDDVSQQHELETLNGDH